MGVMKTGFGGAFTAAMVLLASFHALADEAESRKACESLASLSTQSFRVDNSEWVAASRVPAGPGGETTELPSCLFRVVIDPRPSSIEGVSLAPALN